MKFPRPEDPICSNGQPPASTRRMLLRAIAVVAAGGISGYISRALAMGAVPVNPGIHRVSGPVTVNDRPAQPGSLVRAGDTVATARGGEVIYVVGSDAFLQRGESRVTFGLGAAAPFFRVLTGRLLSVFGKGERELAIPTATIGIRGTGCYIEAAARRSYFCLCYGTVELRPENERPLEYQTAHHESPVWIENGATSRATVINHTDDELIMLEQLVGRWPPFYNAPDPVPY